MNVYALRPDSITDPLAVCEWLDRWRALNADPILVWFNDWTQVSRIGLTVKITQDRIACIRGVAAASGQPVESYLKWLAFWDALCRTDMTGPANAIFTDIGVFPKAIPPRNAETLSPRFACIKPTRIAQAIVKMVNGKTGNDLAFFDKLPDIWDPWVIMCDTPNPTLREIHEKLKG